MATLIVGGAAVLFRPFLIAKGQPVAEVPAPAALFAVTEFAVPPRGRACMSSVTVTPTTRMAEFHLRPVKPTPSGGPPVDLVVNAPGYSSTLSVPGGYPGGSVALALAPPHRAEIGTACFLNRGKAPVLLDGTTEPRTVSRSAVQVNGRPVSGDIALTFLDSRARSLLERLGEVFEHASNLTDGLVPVWTIWVMVVLVAVGIPCSMTFAFYRALREDALAARV